MSRLATTLLALLLFAATGTASATGGGQITAPGQTSPQVLTPPKYLPKAITTRGTTAVVGQSCTGYTSQVVPPSTIRVYRTALGRVDVVDFNTYVKNVLPNEWIASWQPEALKAGAMATKTYAWYRVLHWKGGSLGGQCFDVRDDTADQVYRDGTALSVTNTAVDSTWTTRMLKNGSIFESQYCSNMWCTTSIDSCGYAANGYRLSQWGTQACAARGDTYQQMLARYYYTGLTFDSTTASVSSPAPTGPQSWSGYGDFDGNGTGDLLAADSTGNLQLLTGTGTGYLGTTKTLATGFGAYRGGVRADFTGDNRPDVIAQRLDGSAVIYRGLSGGTLAAPAATTVPWPSSSRLMSPGDMNNDGRADVYGVSPTGELTFYAGNGNGTFATGRVVAWGWNRFKILVPLGRFFGSANTVAGIDATTGQWIFYSASGTGSLKYVRSGYSGYQYFDFVTGAGRFAGTTGADVVAVNRAKGVLWVYRNTGVPTSPLQGIHQTGSGFGAFVGIF